MQWLDLRELSLWANAAIFVAAAAVVWLAGTRISRYAYTISERTGIGKAMLGLMLLGGVTSLPEVAVSLSAGAAGNTALAVNTLLGAVALQVTILAIADAVYGRDALSSIVAQPVVLLQAALDVLLLVAVVAGISIGDTGILGVGIWTSSILILYLVSIWLVRAYQWEPGWRAQDGWSDRPEPWAADPAADVEDVHGRGGGEAERREEQGERGLPLRRVILSTAVAAAAIFIAGTLLSRAGDALAIQTGLGESFVGVALVAVSTSLPEISTVVATVRIRQYEMAFSEIFGSNLFNISLIFLVDVINPAGFVLNQVGPFSLFAALLGITVTIVYLIGLIERKNHAILRMGVDSIIVVLVYLGGLVVLYQLR